MLAQLGFDAIGIDISETAIHAANAYAGRVIGASNMDETRVEPLTGDVRFYQGDFFTQEWQAALPSKQQEKFDLVYDYTVSRRQCVDEGVRTLLMMGRRSSCAR